MSEIRLRERENQLREQILDHRETLIHIRTMLQLARTTMNNNGYHLPQQMQAIHDAYDFFLEWYNEINEDYNTLLNGWLIIHNELASLAH